MFETQGATRNPRPSAEGVSFYHVLRPLNLIQHRGAVDATSNPFSSMLTAGDSVGLRSPLRSYSFTMSDLPTAPESDLRVFLRDTLYI